MSGPLEGSFKAEDEGPGEEFFLASPLASAELPEPERSFQVKLIEGSLLADEFLLSGPPGEFQRLEGDQEEDLLIYLLGL